MKRALLIVPDGLFPCSQYRRLRGLLEQQGFQVQVANVDRVPIAQLGCTVTPDLALGEVRGGDYDILVFIAGRGNRLLVNAPEAHRVAREALAAGRVVAASGSAVEILANAGLLAGREVTGPISLATRLKEKGARYTSSLVAVSDGIVTLRKSEALAGFGRRLLEQAAQKRRGGEAA